MFRHNSNSGNSTSSSLESVTNDNFTTFFGLNGMNLMGLPDMFLDTSTLSTASTQSHSSSSTTIASSSPPTTPLTPDPTSSFGSPPPTFGLPPAEHNLNATMLGAALNAAAAAAAVTATTSAIGNAHTLQNAILLQQQQYRYLLQQQQKQQQQLALAGIAQQQLVLATAAAAVNQHPQDEIANSLKMFAMLSAYKAGNDTGNGQLDVMQEFAANGYTSDELNRYQYQQGSVAAQFPATAATNLNTLATNVGIQHSLATQTSLLQQQQQAHSWLNLSFNEQRSSNIWRNTAAAAYTLASNTAVAAAAAAAININAGTSNASNVVSELANNKLNINNAQHKNQKRHGGNKASSKHCVFCENNNEPEAVVKSHSVRDSLGRVLCPKLRTYVCPICKASGDLAHTVKYCPKKPIITMEDAIKAESFRLAKSAYYKQQMKV